ncbi:MAG: hypothetical protein ABIQ19_09000 [Sphingomonas sp.]
MQQFSDTYLMGIREGREYLNRFRPNLAEARDVLANIECTLRRGFGREVAEMLRGERDFWRNQIKKGALS